MSMETEVAKHIYRMRKSFINGGVAERVRWAMVNVKLV